MREGAFSELGSQPWRHVLAAGSRSQASTATRTIVCLYSPVARQSLFDRYQVTQLGDSVVSSLPKATAQWCRGRTRTRDL